MSRILVPVDFSPASEKALAYALNMMDKNGDELRLLHVYTLPIPDPEMPFELIAQLGDSCKEIAETHIEKLMESLRMEYGENLDLEGITLAGLPVDGILEHVKAQPTDLIVMGMRGKNKLLRKILGTTATRVIQGSDVPVVVVPENVRFTPIRKIAYASNLEEEDLLALDRVISLANTMNAEVHCVHVQKDVEKLDNYKKNLLEEAYRHDLSHSPIHVDILSHQDIVTGLNIFVEYKEIDLLVMLTHPKSIFNRILEGSNTFEMTFQSKIPIWVFQADSNLLKRGKKKDKLGRIREPLVPPLFT